MTTLLNQKLVDDLLAEAAVSPRRRANRNLHADLDDPVQRFFNAIHPDSYVRPHQHVEPRRWECFLVVKGGIALLEFDREGAVLARHELREGQDGFGIELDPGAWHAVVALEPAVMFELKQGPYAALSDKHFADWAPREGDAGCVDVIAWYRTAQVGDRLAQ